MQNDRVKAEAIVSGRVQGVSFRYYTMRRAQMIGLDGWVQNMPNGDVKVVMEGAKGKVKEMLDWLNHGPSLAHVDNLDYSFGDFTGKYHTFDIKF